MNHLGICTGWNCTICSALRRVQGEEKTVRTDCIHLGKYTGQLLPCNECPRVSLQKVFSCSEYGTCTIDKPVNGVACCNNCLSYISSPEKTVSQAKLTEVNAIRGILTWSYGVTTVPMRRGNILDQTLVSLRNAGFDFPHLFVDGDDDSRSWKQQYQLNVTCRSPKVGTAGNWVLSLYELYYRQPDADRFAIFQDDLLICKNAKQYLERCPYPEKGYLNCFTFPSNQNLAIGRKGWYLSNQFGRGAVALVFNRDVTMKLLSAWHMIDRVQDKQRGNKAIDGGIVDSLKPLGIKEYVHNPSLTYHTGQVSAMDNPPHAQTASFVGESFDALTLEPALHS